MHYKKYWPYANDSRHNPIVTHHAPRSILVVITLLVLSGCSSKMALYKPPKGDPLYPINHPMLHFNTLVDRLFLEPVAVLYYYKVPSTFKLRFGNFLFNLSEPLHAFNQACVGKWAHAKGSLSRFFFNTFWGIGGCYDVTRNKIPKRQQSFKQALAHWRVPTGPYIVLPILGPTHARDAAGDCFDFFFSPARLVTYTAPWVTSSRTVTQRANYVPTLRQIYKTSPNYRYMYNTFKSLAEQNAGVHSQIDIEDDIFI